MKEETINNPPVDLIPPPEESEESTWQLTYLDTLTILLCMILILANAATKGNPERNNTMQKTGTQSEEEPFAIQVQWDLNTLYEELQDLFSLEVESGKIELEKGKFAIKMQFAGSIFYSSGEATLLPEGRRILDDIIKQLAEWDRDDFKIDVEGHTDSEPIQTPIYPSNWELSSARASKVIGYFIESGIRPNQLKASGYADTFPLLPEQNERGQKIPENRDKNRRIVIRLFFE